jgi:hypothetical protein
VIHDQAGDGKFVLDGAEASALPQFLKDFEVRLQGLALPGLSCSADHRGEACAAAPASNPDMAPPA